MTIVAVPPPHLCRFYVFPDIVLLAAIQSFKKTAWSLHYFLNERLSHSYASARGAALEHFGAYILVLAFKSPRHLGEVFKFVGSNNLEIGHLVAVHKQNREFVVHLVNITSDAILMYILGHPPCDAQQTLSWVHQHFGKRAKLRVSGNLPQPHRSDLYINP
jgi:hypothetical protein